ncbi:hypothetical protein F9802_06855 [Bacillus aerolatus]|uniref:Uncharacterized protein n=1 Tax=Bacillus aerolatus TaxID=2653354 RepID=A0A6I1FGY7_9BACI|nr:hypothetical protein [Bacillus aerolatus]KAB7707465.1 hypothetical protein F9802_06855 [Bacillus aerolatus]
MTESLAAAAGQKKSGADCSGATIIRQAGEVAFFSHTARLAYDLELQGGEAGQKKSGSVCMDAFHSNTTITNI